MITKTPSHPFRRQAVGGELLHPRYLLSFLGNIFTLFRPGTLWRLHYAGSASRSLLCCSSFSSWSRLFHHDTTIPSSSGCSLLCPSPRCAGCSFLCFCGWSSIRSWCLGKQWRIFCGCHFLTRTSPCGCAILFRSFPSDLLLNNKLLITHRILTCSCHNHQPTTIRTEFRNWLLPDGKVTGRVIVTPIKDPLLLFSLAFYKVTLTYRA